jgi:hypothetical protein
MKSDIWSTIKEDLALVMAQATFNAWLLDSVLVSCDEDLLVVGVNTERAVDWLDNRLRSVVENAVISHLGADVDVEFVVANGHSHHDNDREVAPAPPPAPRPQFMPPAFDTHEAGWFPVSEYECRFWAPYLGRVAWRVWEIVRKADRRREKTAWTPARRWTAPSLASQVPCGRQAITGVNRKCDRNATGAELQDDGVWRRYQPGAFDRLQDAGIAEVERRGSGPHTTYRVRVQTKLPLLSPEQVQDLKARLQVEHDRWLADHGFDPSKWDL